MIALRRTAANNKTMRVWCLDDAGAVRRILGKHSGINLGRYFVLFTDGVEITLQEHLLESGPLLARDD